MMRLFDLFNVHTLSLACLILPMSLAFLRGEVETDEASKAN